MNKSTQLHCITETKSIQLVPFGDIHYGDKSCNIAKAKEMIEWIKKTPNARVILMGDLLNCATKKSVGAAVFDEEIHGQEQLEFFEELLFPIKDKIYGSLVGNHEFRVFKESGYDVTKLMARDLGHKDYGFGAFLKIKINDFNYVIYCTHGSSGSSLSYTKIKSVMNLASYIDADIYLMGHVHSLQCFSQECQCVDLRGRTINDFKKHFVLTGHYLNYSNSYAEMKNMRPDRQGSPVIKLSGDTKRIEILI